MPLLPPSQMPTPGNVPVATPTRSRLTFPADVGVPLTDTFDSAMQSAIADVWAASGQSQFHHPLDAVSFSICEPQGEAD